MKTYLLALLTVLLVSTAACSSGPPRTKSGQIKVAIGTPIPPEPGKVGSRRWETWCMAISSQYWKAESDKYYQEKFATQIEQFRRAAVDCVSRSPLYKRYAACCFNASSFADYTGIYRASRECRDYGCTKRRLYGAQYSYGGRRTYECTCQAFNRGLRCKAQRCEAADEAWKLKRNRYRPVYPQREMIGANPWGEPNQVRKDSSVPMTDPLAPAAR